TTFTVSNATKVAVAVPDFARGPGQAVNLPASGSGLPITISNGAGVTSVSFTLQYDPSLLTISAATTGSGLPVGATLTLSVTSTPGNAILTFTSPTALGSGPKTLGTLTAQVPGVAGNPAQTAPYRAKEVLHFASLLVNGGAIPSVNADAVHVVAYVGDTSG